MMSDAEDMSNQAQSVDPAIQATREQLADAFEWARGVSLNFTDLNNERAAIIMYELGRLKEFELRVERLIDGLVELDQIGDKHVGLCPVHEEKTPSMEIRKDHGTYECLGCGIRGRLADLVIDIYIDDID